MQDMHKNFHYSIIYNEKIEKNWKQGKMSVNRSCINYDISWYNGILCGCQNE